MLVVQVSVILNVILAIIVVRQSHELKLASRAASLANDPLGPMLSATAGQNAPLKERATNSGLQEANTLIGTVDIFDIKSEEARLAGWVLDQTGADSAPRLLFFLDGKFIGSVQPTLRRPDVFNHYKLDEATPTIGYMASFHVGACRVGAEAQALIVSGKHFSTLAPRPVTCEP